MNLKMNESLVKYHCILNLENVFFLTRTCSEGRIKESRCLCQSDESVIHAVDYVSTEKNPTILQKLEMHLLLKRETLYLYPNLRSKCE